MAYAFPNGHLTNLDDSQYSAFEEFKAVCIEEKAYRPGDKETLPSHSDANLLRFLRSRKFNVQPALEQFMETNEWREENDLDGLLDMMDVEEFEETRKLYANWTGRRDKYGKPIFLFRVSAVKSQSVWAYENSKSLKGDSEIKSSERKESAKMLRLCALCEGINNFDYYWASAMEDRLHNPVPITSGTQLVDISNVGMKQFWDLRNHLQDSTRLTTSHYPETLDKLFVIGAPYFFPTIWSWFKKILDSTVASKTFICSSSELLQTLSEHIDIENIPKEYGGELDFAFGDPPRIDPAMVEGMEWGPGAVTMEDGSKGLPRGPLRWEEGEDGTMVAMAIGTQDGRRRREVVGTLNRKYRDVFDLKVPPRTEETGQVDREELEKAMVESAPVETVTGSPTVTVSA